MPPHLSGGEHIDFSADVGITLSCLYILWTSGWILTKFSWIYNWNRTINSLNFGDLGLIFMVTAVEKLKIHGGGGGGGGWTSVFCENTVTSYGFTLGVGVSVLCQSIPISISGR